MKKFLKPELELLILSNDDIVLTSPCPTYEDLLTTVGGSNSGSLGTIATDSPLITIDISRFN